MELVGSRKSPDFLTDSKILMSALSDWVPLTEFAQKWIRLMPPRLRRRNKNFSISFITYTVYHTAIFYGSKNMDGQTVGPNWSTPVRGPNSISRTIPSSGLDQNPYHRVCGTNWTNKPRTSLRSRFSLRFGRLLNMPLFTEKWVLVLVCAFHVFDLGLRDSLISVLSSNFQCLEYECTYTNIILFIIIFKWLLIQINIFDSAFPDAGLVHLSSLFSRIALD